MHALRVEVQHHQLVTLGSKYHLSVGQPLRAEHFVHVWPDNALLLDDRLGEHLPCAKVGRKFHRLKLSATTTLLIGNDVDTVGGDGKR